MRLLPQLSSSVCPPKCSRSLRSNIQNGLGEMEQNSPESWLQSAHTACPAQLVYERWNPNMHQGPMWFSLFMFHINSQWLEAIPLFTGFSHRILNLLSTSLVPWSCPHHPSLPFTLCLHPKPAPKLSSFPCFLQFSRSPFLLFNEHFCLCRQYRHILQNPWHTMRIRLFSTPVLTIPSGAIHITSFL